MKTGSYIDFKACIPSANDINSDVVEAWTVVSGVFTRLSKLKVNLCVSVCISGRLPFWQRIKKMWGIWCGKGLRETYKLSIDNVFISEIPDESQEIKVDEE